MALTASDQKRAFVNEIGLLMVQEARKRGYKVVSAAIAQACIESAYGKSKLSAKYHNYFGLKCGSSWRGASVNMSTKEEYTKGTLTTIKDNFRAYSSMEEGVKGYYDFISSKRYANLKNATTARQYLEYIKADGYATSSTYVSTNMNVVNAYNLNYYDILINNPKGKNPYPEATTNIRKGSSGLGVQWLQFELNLHGYNLVVDGIAGEKTISALIDYQSKNNLVPDGICGVLTRATLKLSSI